MDRNARRRGLKKIPERRLRLYEAIGEILRYTEPKAFAGAPRTIWWDVTLDLRDLREIIENKHPVLKEKEEGKK